MLRRSFSIYHPRRQTVGVQSFQSYGHEGQRACHGPMGVELFQNSSHGIVERLNARVCQLARFLGIPVLCFPHPSLDCTSLLYTCDGCSEQSHHNSGLIENNSEISGLFRVENASILIDEVSYWACLPIEPLSVGGNNSV